MEEERLRAVNMFLLEYICEQYEMTEFEANGVILAGKVFINQVACTSVKYNIKKGDKIHLKYKKEKYVTRSGYKLEKALSVFQVDVKDRVCADIGASEGGFTDCLLQNGAGKVYAVDVAYGILNWKVRSDSRVVAIERMNARHINNEVIPQICDLITLDVAFISTRAILPSLVPILNPQGCFIILFKPQFELKAEQIGKHGNIKSHQDLVDELIKYRNELQNMGIFINQLSYSPIKGNHGNVEFLVLAYRIESDIIHENQIIECVSEAFQII